MVRKSFLIGLAAVLVIGITAVAFAAPNRTTVSPFAGLDLTDEQYSKLQEISDDFFDTMQDLRGKLAEKTHELRTLYLQKEPDEGAIEKLSKEISLIEEEMRGLHQDKFDNMSGLFTDEQLEELKASRGPAFGNNPGFSGMGRGKGMGMHMGTRSGGRQGYCGLGFGMGNGWKNR